jgi:hypothetical protein
MFSPGEKVVCVDDTHPNPLCTFPGGYVVSGSIYTVLDSPGPGVRIEGKPVHLVLDFPGLGSHTLSFDSGWKPHRFRRFHDNQPSSQEEDELELVGTR